MYIHFPTAPYTYIKIFLFYGIQSDDGFYQDFITNFIRQVCSGYTSGNLIE